MNRSLTKGDKNKADKAVKQVKEEHKEPPESMDHEFVTANFSPPETACPAGGSMGTFTTTPGRGSSNNLLSSSEAPSSGTTNTSAAPSSSSAGSGWPSQTDLRGQVEDKNREISLLQSKLGEAEAKLEAVETRIAGIIGVNKTGLESVRAELGGMRSQVDNNRTDVLTMVAELTRTLVESLGELEEVNVNETKGSNERGQDYWLPRYV